MRSSRARLVLDNVDSYWDDHARLLGHTGYTQFKPLFAKDGNLTQAQFEEYLQRTLSALHRTIKGNGHRHGFVKIVSGRSKSYADLSTWRVNIDDSWRLIVHNYTWNWTESTGKGGEMKWMRAYQKATKAFFERALYLPPTRPEPKPRPTKDQAREGKIKALEDRRDRWLAKQARAEKAVVKIDRSLRALRRYQQAQENE